MNWPKGYLVNHHRSNGIKDQLKRAEECLSEDRVQEDGLQRRRKIGVYPIHPQRFVMSQMILSKAGRVWQPDREIYKNGEQPIVEWCSEGEIMTDFVDG